MYQFIQLLCIYFMGSVTCVHIFQLLFCRISKEYSLQTLAANTYLELVNKKIKMWIETHRKKTSGIHFKKGKKHVYAKLEWFTPLELKEDRPADFIQPKHSVSHLNLLLRIASNGTKEERSVVVDKENGCNLKIAATTKNKLEAGDTRSKQWLIFTVQKDAIYHDKLDPIVSSMFWYHFKMQVVHNEVSKNVKKVQRTSFLEAPFGSFSHSTSWIRFMIKGRDCSIKFIVQKDSSYSLILSMQFLIRATPSLGKLASIEIPSTFYNVRILNERMFIQLVSKIKPPNTNQAHGNRAIKSQEIQNLEERADISRDLKIGQIDTDDILLLPKPPARRSPGTLNPLKNRNRSNSSPSRMTRCSHVSIGIKKSARNLQGLNALSSDMMFHPHKTLGYGSSITNTIYSFEGYLNDRTRYTFDSGSIQSSKSRFRRNTSKLLHTMNNKKQTFYHMANSLLSKRSIYRFVKKMESGRKLDVHDREMMSLFLTSPAN